MELDNEALRLLRHSSAHILAEAVLKLYPDAKLGIGPTIEEGFYYDIKFTNPIIDADLAKIEKEMHKLLSTNRKIEKEIITYEDAKKLFKDNPYKLELIEEYHKEGRELSIYKQGSFYDLCAGPHLEETKPIKYFKLLSLAGAYWRGDIKKDQLTRIYGTAFYSQEDLNNYLTLVEERKKRDHRLIGKEMKIFMMSEYGPGFPFFLPNGMIIRDELENYWKELHRLHGYEFILTPTMLSKELWLTSGHYANYKDNMFFSRIDEKEFAIKPMSCPGAMLVYKNDLHSYRELPIRLAELGHVHRYEASGALSGLFRVRAFTQDDAHIFLREDQLQDEIITLLKLYDTVYKQFNLSYHIELSTRPLDKYIGSIDIWDKSEHALEEAIKHLGIPYKINPGDGAFYGPKLDFKLKDSMNRIWQCGTIQLDMNLPERFDITYIDQNNEKVRPIMLHRAIFGSIERFIGILIENYAGHFPLWLAPEQVAILPVAKPHEEKANEIASKLKELKLRPIIFTSEEKLGYRMRQAQIRKIPYTIVLGDDELNSNSVTYRKAMQKEQINVSLDEFIAMLKKERDERI